MTQILVIKNFENEISMQASKISLPSAVIMRIQKFLNYPS